MSGTHKLKELSVFFPLYNEEANVESLVSETLEVIPTVADKFEILLINDGSTDTTESICKSLEKKHKGVKCISQKNKGYGGALKTGFKNAKYAWVFFSDGDLQFRLSDIQKFIPEALSSDLIIGYRKNRAEGFGRHIIATLLKFWNHLFFNFPFFIKDIDCAFKLIKKSVLDELRPFMSDGAMISTELLLRSYKKGYKIKQIPVTHYERNHGNSSGSDFKVIKKAVIDTFRLGPKFYDEFNIRLLFLFCVLLFLSLVPVSMHINYMQSDEYTHYRIVQSILDGKPFFDPYLGATFYLQALIGAVFALFFGIQQMPILTLMVSVGTFFVLEAILLKFYKKPLTTTLLIGGILFLNPLYIYSTFGFMTEMYFLFFLMCSVYFIYEFNTAKKYDYAKKVFLLANLFIILSYFIRQVAFVTSLAFAINLLLNKKPKYALYQFLLFVGLVFYHYKFFPLTPQMYDSNIHFTIVAHLKRTLSLIYVLGIYLAVFIAPVIFFVFVPAKKLDVKRLLTIAFTAVLVFTIFESHFETKKVVFQQRTRDGKVFSVYARGEFPYLENVLGRKGFLDDTLYGVKAHYPGFFDFFNALDILGRVLLSILVAYMLVTLFKNYRRYEFIYILGFVLLLLLTPKVYDRYLLPLVPFLLIFLVPYIPNGRYFKLFTLAFLAFLFMFSYQYMADYMQTNRYVWNKAQELTRVQHVNPSMINANHAWRELYPNANNKWVYYFDYGGSSRVDNLNYELVESHAIGYPGNIFRDSRVLLFRRLDF